MKTIGFCLLIVLLLAAPAGAQPQWVKSFGAAGFEYAFRIAMMPDGGFITAGTRSPQGSSDEDFWISRFTSTGEHVWDTSFGKKGTQETLFGFLQTKDYGFMVGGFTGRQFSGNEVATMYRGDSTGKLLWNLDVNYSSSDHWHFFVERPEGGYYMGGHTDSKGGDAGEMWLVKMDSSRQFIWERTFGRGIGTEEHAHMGVATDDGGMFLLGHTESNLREKWWVARIDSAGNSMWDKVLSSGDDFHDSPYGLFRTNEGNFALIGGSGSAIGYTGSIWLVVIDPDGKILVDKHYGDANSESFGWNGRQTSDGGYLLAGYTSYKTKGRQDMYIVKTDKDGEIEWEKIFGGTLADLAYDAVETADGWIAVGITESPELDAGGEGDLMMVKWAKDLPVAPAAPQLVTPVNGTMGTTTAPTLTWQAAPTATRYRVQAATDFTFANPVLDDSTVSGTSRAAAGLALNTRYYWRVQGINTGGTGAWSEIWSFTTAVSGVHNEQLAADGAALLGNAPDPFRTVTRLGLRLDAGMHVSARIVDMYGHEVQNAFDGNMEAGEHAIRIDGTPLAAGAYLAVVRVTAPDGGTRVLSKRLTVVK